MSMEFRQFLSLVSHNKNLRASHRLGLQIDERIVRLIKSVGLHFGSDFDLCGNGERFNHITPRDIRDRFDFFFKPELFWIIELGKLSFGALIPARHRQVGTSRW